MQLSFEQRIDTNRQIFSGVISPYEEMGAYEALWNQQGMTFKKLADLFRDHPDAKPSSFVDFSQIHRYTSLVEEIWTDKNISNIGVRVRGASEYPEALRDAKHPVELIYYQGNWDLIHTPCVAVVGSRKPSEDGKRRARKIGYQLAKNDITVVSGLAEGIDYGAHCGALKAGGNTIAIIGTPLTECYPAKHKVLQTEIAVDHLLISQVPFYRYSQQTPRINRTFFPERNKVMSALTSATIIVEAGETSGTLVQASAAISQGRKLLIMQNCFENKNISWPAKYEQKGAIRVSNFEDVRHHLGF